MSVNPAATAVRLPLLHLMMFVVIALIATPRTSSAASDFKLTIDWLTLPFAAEEKCKQDYGNDYFFGLPDTAEDNEAAKIAAGGSVVFLSASAQNYRWSVYFGPDKGRVFWINTHFTQINNRYHKYQDTSVSNGKALVMDFQGNWKSSEHFSFKALCQRMPCEDVCSSNVQTPPTPGSYFPNCNCDCIPGWQGLRCDILFRITCEGSQIYKGSAAATQTYYNDNCATNGGGYLAAPQGEDDRQAILSLGRLSAGGPYALTGGVQSASKWHWKDGPYKDVEYSNSVGGALNGQSVFWHSGQPGGTLHIGMIMFPGTPSSPDFSNIMWVADNLQNSLLKCYICQYDPNSLVPSTATSTLKSTLTAHHNTATVPPTPTQPITTSHPVTTTTSLAASSSVSMTSSSPRTSTNTYSWDTNTATSSSSNTATDSVELTHSATLQLSATGDTETYTATHSVSPSVSPRTLTLSPSVNSDTQTYSHSPSHRTSTTSHTITLSVTQSSSASSTASFTTTHSQSATLSGSSSDSDVITTSISSSPLTATTSLTTSQSMSLGSGSVSPSTTKSIIPVCVDVVHLTACPQCPLAVQTPGLIMTTGNLSTRIFDSSRTGTTPTIAPCDGQYISQTATHAFGIWSGKQAVRLEVPALPHPFLRPTSSPSQASSPLLLMAVYDADIGAPLPHSDVEVAHLINYTMDSNDSMISLSLIFRGSKRLTGLTVDIAVPVSSVLNCQAPNGTRDVYLAYRVVLQASPKIVDVQAVTDAISTPAVGVAVLSGLPGGVIRAGMLSSLSSLIRCSPMDLTAELPLLSNALGIGMGGAEGYYQRGSLVSGAVIIVAVSALLIAVTVPAKMIILMREHRLEVGVDASDEPRPPPTWRDAVSFVYLPSALFAPIAVASEGWVPSGVTLATMPSADYMDIVGGAIVLVVIAAYLFHVLYVTGCRPPVAPVVLVYPGDEARRARGVPSTRDGLRRIVMRLLFLPRSGIVARPDLRLPGPRPVVCRGRAINHADTSSNSSSDSNSDEDVEMASNHSGSSSSSSDGSNNSHDVALVAVSKNLKGAAAKLPVYRADEVAALVTRGGIDQLASHSKEGQIAAHWLLRYSRYSEDSYRLWLLGFEFLVGTGINVIDGFVYDACLEKAIVAFVLAASMLAILITLKPLSVFCQQIFCITLYIIFTITSLLAVINAVVADPIIDDAASMLLVIGSGVVVIQSVLDIVISLAEAQSAFHLTAAGIRRGTQRARNAIRFIHFGGDVTPVEERRADREEQEQLLTVHDIIDDTSDQRDGAAPMEILAEEEDSMQTPVDEELYIKEVIEKVQHMNSRTNQRRKGGGTVVTRMCIPTTSKKQIETSSLSIVDGDDDLDSNEIREIDAIIHRHESQQHQKQMSESTFNVKSKNHHGSQREAVEEGSRTRGNQLDMHEIDALIALQDHKRL